MIIEYLVIYINVYSLQVTNGKYEVELCGRLKKKLTKSLPNSINNLLKLILWIFVEYNGITYNIVHFLVDVRKHESHED